MTSDGSLTPMTIFYEAKKLNTKLNVLKVWYISWRIPVKVGSADVSIDFPVDNFGTVVGENPTP